MNPSMRRKPQRQPPQVPDAVVMQKIEILFRNVKDVASVDAKDGFSAMFQDARFDRTPDEFFQQVIEPRLKTIPNLQGYRIVSKGVTTKGVAWITVRIKNTRDAER
jgi:hypothetical protein